MTTPTSPGTKVRDIHDAGAMLVRPDGYIAWRQSDPVWDADEATDRIALRTDRILATPNRPRPTVRKRPMNPPVH